jgi:hypothetical protein
MNMDEPAIFLYCGFIFLLTSVWYYGISVIGGMYNIHASSLNFT